MKNIYLILLIVVIVGIVAIFALTFLTAGDQNLTGASIWGGSECSCGSASSDNYAVCISCCKDYARESSTNNCETSQYRCQQCGGN